MSAELNDPAESLLLAEEIARVRIFLVCCAVMGGIFAAGAPFLSAPRGLRLGLVLSCGFVAAASLWGRFRLADASRYTAGRLTVATALLMMSTSIGVLLFGVFSPAPMLGAIGIYAFALGGFRQVAIGNFLVAAVLHALFALLITFEVVPDPGLFKATARPLGDKILATVVVEVVYVVTLVLARLSRAATRAAMTRLQTARLQVSKREALLAEANAELDRAQLGEQLGRMSERELGGYRLGPVIGRGGMSEIYRAVRLADGHPAALKVMHERHAGDARQVRRFLREAEIIRALKSRHVVRLYDVSVDVSGGAPAYLAMELLVGHDLGWHLRRDRRFTPARVLRLVEHVADALVEAAGASIVHRDLKPQNLFAVDTDDPGAPIWKVLDFGAGKMPDAATLTRGNIIGTPGYLAPEQVQGGEVGPATDVFALTLIAYRALTGRPAFTGRDVPKLLFDVCYVQPLRPGALVSLGDDVERVLALGFAKSPRERFAGADELAAALKAALADSLAPPLRERADALIAREPWGERIRGA